MAKGKSSFVLRRPREARRKQGADHEGLIRQRYTQTSIHRDMLVLQTRCKTAPDNIRNIPERKQRM
jgi:hypothetical protein